MTSHPDILLTEFVQNYVDVMWDKIFWQVIWDTFVIYSFTLLLTFDIRYQIRSPGLYGFMLLYPLYWITIEVYMAKYKTFGGGYGAP